jgi:hypothetical protein
MEEDLTELTETLQTSGSVTTPTDPRGMEGIRVGDDPLYHPLLDPRIELLDPRIEIVYQLVSILDERNAPLSSRLAPPP